MRRFFFFAAAFFLLSAVVPAQSSRQPAEPKLQAAISAGVDLILKQEYSKADSLFSRMSREYPDYPAGYLYRAAVMQARSVDFSVPVDREKFDSLLVLGKAAAEKIRSPWKEYYLGTADGYDAYERADRGAWVTAVRSGSSGASELEKVIEKDSSFYDAYVGVGTYYYWRSRKTAFLHWIPFVHDSRAEGIRLLRIAAERAPENRFAAISALISIGLDAGDYGQVEHWSKEALRRYPNTRIFLWGLATAYDRSKRYREAIPAYRNLLKSICSAGEPHPYDEIVCRLNLSKSLLAAADTAGVRAQMQVLLSYASVQFPEALEKRAEAKFRDARRILNSLGTK
jgi:tetratricopeptide (TPR) repeat protein